MELMCSFKVVDTNSKTMKNCKIEVSMDDVKNVVYKKENKD